MACNVADPAAIEAMVEAVLGEWGRIDVLMNNAAIQPPGNNADVVPKHWRLMYRVNVHGTFDCFRAVLPTMREQGRGNIINISSAATRGGTPYGGSKRAVEALTEGLADELAEEGVAVNSLKPVDAIETPGFLFAQVPRGGEGALADKSEEIGSASWPDLPPPDSYVEAAVLLAMQTPATFTGRVYNDAEVIGLLGDAALRERMRALNPEPWCAAINAIRSD